MAIKTEIKYNEDTQEFYLLIPEHIVEEYSLDDTDVMYWEEIEDEVFTVSLNNS
jgi:hypothetical protein